MLILIPITWHLTTNHPSAFWRSPSDEAKRVTSAKSKDVILSFPNKTLSSPLAASRDSIHRNHNQNRYNPGQANTHWKCVWLPVVNKKDTHSHSLLSQAIFSLSKLSDSLQEPPWSQGDVPLQSLPEPLLHPGATGLAIHVSYFRKTLGRNASFFSFSSKTWTWWSTSVEHFQLDYYVLQPKMIAL